MSRLRVVEFEISDVLRFLNSNDSDPFGPSPQSPVFSPRGFYEYMTDVLPDCPG